MNVLENRFADSHHDHRQKLLFHDGRVAPDTLSAFLFEGRAPVKVFKGVAVGNGTRRVQALGLKPERQPLPGVSVTRQGKRALAMPFHEFRNPGVPAFAVDDRHAMMFLGFQFGPQGFRLGSVIRAVGTQAGGTVNLLLVGVKIDDIPEGRTVFAV